MKKSNFQLTGVLLLSAAILAYELSVMRTFSIGSWSNFGSMVISIALLGFGLAGTFLTFMQKRLKGNLDNWLSLTAMILAPLMAISHVISQFIPFNPVLIVSDPVQIWWIGAYYLVYSIPFVCGAVFIGIAFISLSEHIHRLYFWNMAGSGIGGFFILGCMYIFPPDILNLPILVLTFISGLLCSVDFKDGGKITFNYRHIVVGVAGLAVSIFILSSWGQIKVSDYKSVSYVRKYPEFNLDYYSYSPLGEMHLYSSSYFHFAPGLSDNASNEMKKMPANAFKGLFIDGGGPIGVMEKLGKDEESYIDFLPTSAPYKLLKDPDVFLVGLGGGAGIFTALHHDARKVVAVESNPDLIHLLKDVPVVRKYNGDILLDPRITVLNGEPRAYCAGNKGVFDLAEISLIDSVGLSQTGGYPVVENYTYTVEAVADYMKSLKDDGILSITVWNKLSPPRNVPRLLTTVVESLNRQKISDPGSHIFVFSALLQTATVLVKKSGFTKDDIDKLNGFCKSMSFDVSFYPGIPEFKTDFNKLLKDYNALFAKPKVIQLDMSSDASGKDSNLLSLLKAVNKENVKEDEMKSSDFYHFSLLWMLNGKTGKLFNDYVFDIRPATDERPYYTAYLKTSKVGSFINQLDKVSEEWGYIMLCATFVISILAALLIIIMPVIGRWKELFRKQKGTVRVIIYYASLGLAYMLVEIFLTQRLVFFLEDSIFSFSIVITTMLVISGIGSLFSDKFFKSPSGNVRLAAAGIGVSLLFYIFGLTPLLNVCLGMPFAVKIFLAMLFIVPSAFFMGMPFPTGLSVLSKNRKGLLPWAWGMNGALSVTGSVLARILSVSWGFVPVLVTAIVLYAICAVFFKCNEITES
jgi:hypothetical protein